MPIDDSKIDANNIVNQHGGRIAGIVIGACSLLTIFVMMHHPTVHSSNFEEFVEEVGHHQVVNGMVHGSAIVVVALYFFGFSWLSTLLGLGRSDVRLGMVAYAVGGLAMIMAATISGFIVPAFVDGMNDASIRDAEMASLVVKMLRESNHAFDQIGVIGMSLGVLFWSAALLLRPHRHWLLGILGLIVGICGVGGFVTGHLEASVQGIILFVILQAIWNLAIAMQLIRKRI